MSNRKSLHFESSDYKRTIETKTDPLTGKKVSILTEEKKQPSSVLPIKRVVTLTEDSKGNIVKTVKETSNKQKCTLLRNASTSVYKDPINNRTVRISEDSPSRDCPLDIVVITKEVPKEEPMVLIRKREMSPVKTGRTMEDSKYMAKPVSASPIRRSLEKFGCSEISVVPDSCFFGRGQASVASFSLGLKFTSQKKEVDADPVRPFLRNIKSGSILEDSGSATSEKTRNEEEREVLGEIFVSGEKSGEKVWPLTGVRGVPIFTSLNEMNSNVATPNETEKKEKVVQLLKTENVNSQENSDKLVRLNLPSFITSSYKKMETTESKSPIIVIKEIKETPITEEEDQPPITNICRKIEQDFSSAALHSSPSQAPPSLHSTNSPLFKTKPPSPKYLLTSETQPTQSPPKFKETQITFTTTTDLPKLPTLASTQPTLNYTSRNLYSTLSNYNTNFSRNGLKSQRERSHSPSYLQRYQTNYTSRNYGNCTARARPSPLKMQYVSNYRSRAFEGKNGAGGLQSFRGCSPYRNGAYRSISTQRQFRVGNLRKSSNFDKLSMDLMKLIKESKELRESHYGVGSGNGSGGEVKFGGSYGNFRKRAGF